MAVIGVVGAGTMGHGIAQVCAMAGYDTRLTDNDSAGLARGIAKVRANLDKGVERGKVTPEVRDRALANLRPAAGIGELADGADFVIEAIPEVMDWKQALFEELEKSAPAHCIFGTNTSSISVTTIASELSDPSRVIGTHFFNPVHIMSLLELIVGDKTRPDVLDATLAFAESIGKEAIVVQDFPGFATSRLGVCLGMEAIRMVEQGVASAEDIDKAMTLGYRHPMGPLRLTDLVGLDVRLKIGEYLAKELGNPAFEPPALMREMVAAGKLGKKSGVGFYLWNS